MCDIRGFHDELYELYESEHCCALVLHTVSHYGHECALEFVVVTDYLIIRQSVLVVLLWCKCAKPMA